MKKIFSIILLLISYNQLFCQANYYELIWKADSCYSINKFEIALTLYENAFEIKKGSINEYYNAACSAALANDSILSFKYIKRIIDMGFESIEYLKNDKDLNNLKEHKKWMQLLSYAERKKERRESKYNLNLKKELLKIYEVDQKYRLKLDEFYKKYGYSVQNDTINMLRDSMYINDSINLIKVEKIINNYGWLGIDKIGSKANKTIFLIIQHSNIDIVKKYIPLLRKSVLKEKTPSEYLALMEDQLAIACGLKQLYGTQVQCDNNGICKVYPIKDETKVNLRREKIGLEPLQYYLRKYNINWKL